MPYCLICKRPIKDEGNLFCKKCRRKPLKVRFKAFKKSFLSRDGRLKNYRY